MKKTALLALTLVPFILSGDESEPPQEITCHSPYHVVHAGVRHTEANGVGYKEGYTTVEGFGIYNENTSFMPFLDLRGHVFNNGKLAGNVGIGERTLIPSIDHLFGIYLYYDVRKANRFTVNQLSPGIELLGRRMEYRINGYFPVGRRHSRKFGYKFHQFQGNNILLQNKQNRAMIGGDAEAGVHITQNTTYDVFAAAGPYYFHTEHASSWGGKARLLGRYKEYVSLEASYSYDRLFRNVVQGTIAFSYPFGKTLKRKGKTCPQQNDLVMSRAAFAPYRFEIPVVKKVTQKSKAINTTTGLPWQVWFVDNTSHSAGTFESPFPTLLEAQNASSPNEMIYVFPGDGTTTGMDVGITLQEGQPLFGSAISHLIPTSKGNVTIPAFSTTAPTITNTGDVITLANGNKVSGMNVVVAIGQTGIRAFPNMNWAMIDHNVFSGAGSYRGFDVASGAGQGVQGSLFITDNQFTSSNVVGAFSAIFVRVISDQFANINISNNTFSGFNNAMNLGPASTTSTAEILISGNTISGYGSTAINYFTGMVDSTIQIVKNTIFDTIGTAAPIFCSISNTPNAGSIFIGNNTITSTNTTPLISGINVSGATARVSIFNNNIQTGTGNGSRGINIFSPSTKTICASITNNQIEVQAPAGTGMGLGTGVTGIINIDNFSGNIAPNIVITGNVNRVAPNTCGQ